MPFLTCLEFSFKVWEGLFEFGFKNFEKVFLIFVSF